MRNCQLFALNDGGGGGGGGVFIFLCKVIEWAGLPKLAQISLMWPTQSFDRNPPNK